MGAQERRVATRTSLVSGLTAHLLSAASRSYSRGLESGTARPLGQRSVALRRRPTFVDASSRPADFAGTTWSPPHALPAGRSEVAGFNGPQPAIPLGSFSRSDGRAQLPLVRCRQRWRLRAAYELMHIKGPSSAVSAPVERPVKFSRRGAWSRARPRSSLKVQGNLKLSWRALPRASGHGDADAFVREVEQLKSREHANRFPYLHT